MFRLSQRGGFKYSWCQPYLKGRSQNVDLPDKTHCTVYYTVPVLTCKSLKYIHIPAATNSSKAQVARSNRAGQAKFHIGSYKSRLVD